MPRLLILHTNDVHGRQDALLRCATVIARERAATDAATVYLDAGDVEDTSNRLSNLTKGLAMNRLLVAAGVDAVTLGNASMLRYGPPVLEDYERVLGRPQLAANVERGDAPLPGTTPAVLLERGGVRVGVIGLTPPMFSGIYDVWGISMPDAEEVTRLHSARLRADGADVVVLLSHLGLDADRALAGSLGRGVVDVIVGGHSHSLLESGEWVDGVPIAQAGDYGRYVGRIAIAHGEVEMRAIEVGDEEPAHPPLVRELERIEQEVAERMAEPLGRLESPLEVAADRECSAGRFMADVLRERTAADVAVVCSGAAFVDSLPRGTLTRGALYEACPSPGVAAAATLTGTQLLRLVAHGLDPDFAAVQPRELRGATRGLLHLSGGELREGVLRVAGEPVDPERRYRVGASDWELNPYGGYVTDEWELDVENSDTTILRELVEERLARDPMIRPTVPRWDGVPLRPL